MPFAGVHCVPGTHVGRVASPHPDWRLGALRRLPVLVVHEAVTDSPLAVPGARIFHEAEARYPPVTAQAYR